MSTRFYDTDLADAAWAFVAPVLPAARTDGRPRTTNLRAVLNAIFYLLRTGCQWRLLSREFPPGGTVYHYFQAWQNSGVWVHLHRVLYELARRHAGRAASRRAVLPPYPGPDLSFGFCVNPAKVDSNTKNIK